MYNKQKVKEHSMYTQEQQLQIAVAYAKTVSNNETTPDEFLNYINKMLEKFKPAKESEITFNKSKIDPSSLVL